MQCSGAARSWRVGGTGDKRLQPRKKTHVAMLLPFAFRFIAPGVGLGLASGSSPLSSRGQPPLSARDFTLRIIFAKWLVYAMMAWMYSTYCATARGVLFVRLSDGPSEFLPRARAARLCLRAGALGAQLLGQSQGAPTRPNNNTSAPAASSSPSKQHMWGCLHATFVSQ